MAKSEYILVGSAKNMSTQIYSLVKFQVFPPRKMDSRWRNDHRGHHINLQNLKKHNKGKNSLHFQERLNSHSHTHPCYTFLSHLPFVLLYTKISDRFGHFECKSVRPGIKAVLL